MSLFKAIMELRDAIRSGAELATILEKFKTLLDIAFGRTEFAAKEAKKGEDVKAAIEACREACEVRLTEVAAAPEEKGKLGDGVLLKIILDALIKFAPLFI